MKLPALRRTLFAFYLAIPAICAGCNRHDAGGKPATSTPAPEASFRRIMESFRRKVEDQPVAFVVSNGGSRSTMIGSNKVSSNVIPPASEGEHYKAVVTVESQSRYSLRHSKNSSDESEHDQNAKTQGTNPLTEPGDKKGIAILAPDLAGQPSNESSAGGSKSNPSNEETVTRQRDEQVRKYELTYENDRWVLLTKLNPETEKAIQFAFDEALARQ